MRRCRVRPGKSAHPLHVCLHRAVFWNQGAGLEPDPRKGSGIVDEQVLKFHESRINAMLGANGAIYAIRTALYEPLPENTIIDDFCVFMGIARQGYKLTYNPEARATEEIAPNLEEEAGRRIRIGAGNYQAMMRLTWALNPLAGSRCFSYISHKILRWWLLAKPVCITLG